MDAREFLAGFKRGHSATAIVGLVLLTAVIIVALLRDRFVQYPQWQVSIAGEARMPYDPDMAVVTLGVMVDNAATAELALSRLNTAMGRIVPALKKLGVLDDNIKTLNYTLNSNYDYLEGRSRLSGYNANQQLIVRVPTAGIEASSVNDVIETASKNGANQILGVAFESDDIADIRQQAFLSAVADAKERAATISGATGVRLGKLVGWYEEPIGDPIPYYVSGAGYGGDLGGGGRPEVPIAADEIVVRVNLNYLIK